MSTGPEIVLRDAVMHVYKPSEPATAVVVKNELATASKKAAGFARHIEFDLTGTNLIGKFIPGQSIGIIPPGADSRGLSHKLRLYSVSSPSAGEDGQGRVVSTIVKRLIDEHWEHHRLYTGVCSNYLCDLQPGDTVKITGPAGKKFVLPRDVNAHDYLFFATGTGIAPFRGMVKDLLAAGCTSRIALVMGSPYATDLLYDDYFRSVSAKHTNFVYLPTISRERNGGGEHGKMYVQDRLSKDTGVLMPMLERGREGGTLIYICGLAGMELGIFKALATRLPGDALGQYLDVDAEAMAKVEGWERSMLHKQIRPTRRVFMEVYS